MGDDETLEDFQKTMDFIGCITQHAEDCYIILDRKGRLRHVNDYAAACLGGRSQDFIGKPMATVLPLLAMELRERFERVLLSGETLSFEHEFRLEGRCSWCQFHLSPVKDSAGKVIAVLCTGHDVTERKKQENVIERSKQEWLRVVDNLPQLVAVVGGDHRIERVNAMMADRLKLDVRKVVGKLCYKTLLGLRSPPSSCLLNKATSGATMGCTQLSGKQIGCQSISIVPIRDAQGMLTGCIFIGHPIQTVSKGSQTEQCVRSLIRKMDHVVRIHDPHGRYLFFAGIEAGNLTNADVAGKTPYDFFEPATASEMLERLKRVATGGKEITEMSEVGWKGETFHFVDQVSPLRDDSGKLLGLVTISRKVAESRLAGRHNWEKKSRAEDLTPREREVVQLIGRGASAKEVAKKLGISLKTVETHRSRIMQKLDIHKSSELARFAVEAGLL